MPAIRFAFILAIVIFCGQSYANNQSEALFHAKFLNQKSELHIEVPTKLIEPTLKEHYSYLDDRKLSKTEINLYLEMYLRETVRLQYGAFPMALGESGISQQKGQTKLVMKLAKLPKEARELLVEINSFAQNPKQKNVFKITKSFNKQTYSLSGQNAYTANVPL